MDAGVGGGGRRRAATLARLKSMKQHGVSEQSE